MKIFLAFALLIPLLVRAQGHPDSTGPTTSYCYRIAQPPITSVPPLHTDMDLETLLGYVYWDSLMRSAVPDSIISGFKAMQSIDSIKPFMRFLYSITNYDAALFDEYWMTGNKINPSYWGPPGAVLSAIRKKICGAIGYATPTDYLINTSYVLHIRVLSVASDSDTTFIPWRRVGRSMPIRCVQAQILDTVKGFHLLSELCGSPMAREKGSQPLSDSTPCIRFFYSPIWPRQVFDCNSFELNYGTNPYGDSAFAEDSEYIVFLQANYLDYDGTNAYFDVQPITTYDSVGGVYPIVGGMVQDAHNFFGLGTSVSVSNFEAGLRNTINSIYQ